MALELKTEGMRLNPGKCFICNSTPSRDGKPLPAIEPVGVDINWGETPYICLECAHLIADLVDRVDPTEHDALKEEYDALSKDHRKLNAAHVKLRRQAKAMAEGKRAKLELKEEANA